MSAQDESDRLFDKLADLLGKDPSTGRQRTLNDAPTSDQANENETFPVKDLLDELLDHPAYAEIERLVERRLTAMFLASLKMTDEECAEAEKAEQRTPLWFIARFRRLTASVFGTAAKHNPFDKSANALLRTMLWNIRFKGSAATQYGTDLEPVARDGYLAFMRKWRDDATLSVDERNFFVCPTEPWLGYSPDGFMSAQNEPAPAQADVQRLSGPEWDPAKDPVLVEAEKWRQSNELPFKKPRGPMSTCFDSNPDDIPDKKWIAEPIFEVFFDNETLERVPFEKIPDECFGKVKKVYGKKFNNSNAPKTNWPTPPPSSAGASAGFF